jgi:NAD(P)-dependent dehydrogenase (short-subunit alcohol dehydrogenase family)
MSTRLERKTALVTGATSNIGRSDWLAAAITGSFTSARRSRR